MGRCAPSRLGSTHRLVSRRLTLEQLESRLPPGDMIGLAGTALWGLGLADAGRGLQIAPLATLESPLFYPEAVSATAWSARPSTSTQISFVPGYPTANEQARLTSTSGAEQELADHDLFQSGLSTPFDVPRPAHPNPEALSQVGSEHGNQADLLRGPAPAGGGRESPLASSAEPIPQPLPQLPSSTGAGSVPPMNAATAGPSSRSKAATASALPAPANPSGAVVSPGPGIGSSNNSATPSVISPDMPESSTPPWTPP
jgi:hypothetical protein